MQTRRLSGFILLGLLMSLLMPISVSITEAQAEVVEVEGQGDCPGGNDGWQRHLIVDIAAKRTYTRCVRIEVVPVPTPTPTPTPTTSSGSAPAPAPAPAPETVSRVAGATDPYPNIATGGEIPGTRIWSTTQTSWNDFYNYTNSISWRCPVIYGPNGDPYAAESNGFDPGAGKWFRVCVKNPWREPIPRSVTSNYEAQKSAAMAEALAKSQAWNTENPGLQKCFQWGPLTNPNGGTESGGVCANPIGITSGTSQSDTRTVTSQSDTRTLTTTTIRSETVTAAVEVIAAISNVESRTASTANLLKTLDVTEKENLLNVEVKSTKSAVINVDSVVLGVNVVLTATKKGSKDIVFKARTDSDGDAQIKTSRNLLGYTITLSINGVKLDTDKAIKK